MPKQVFITRSPDHKKVTTVDIRLGAKAIPFAWEYTIIETSDVPAGKLKSRWDELVKNKKIYLSTRNEHKISSRDIDTEDSLIANKLQSLSDHRKRMLRQLDVEFIRSIEDYDRNSIYRQEAVKKFKVDLRAWSISVDDFTNREEFLEYWPEVFDKTFLDYMPLPYRKWLTVAGITILTLTIIVPIFVVLFT